MLHNRTKVEKIGGIVFLVTMSVMVYGFIRFLSLDLSSFSLLLVPMGKFFLVFLMVGLLVILSIGGVVYWITSFLNAVERELNPTKSS